MVIPVSGRTRVVSKAVSNDWVALCGVTTSVGRTFEPRGRSIISGFETLGTKAEAGLLRVVRAVLILGLCGSEFFDDIT